MLLEIAYFLLRTVLLSKLALDGHDLQARSAQAPASLSLKTSVVKFCNRVNFEPTQWLDARGSCPDCGMWQQRTADVIVQIQMAGLALAQRHLSVVEIAIVDHNMESKVPL